MGRVVGSRCLHKGQIVGGRGPWVTSGPWALRKVTIVTHRLDRALDVGIQMNLKCLQTYLIYFSIYLCSYKEPTNRPVCVWRKGALGHSKAIPALIWQ